MSVQPVDSYMQTWVGRRFTIGATSLDEEADTYRGQSVWFLNRPGAFVTLEWDRPEDVQADIKRNARARRERRFMTLDEKKVKADEQHRESSKTNYRKRKERRGKPKGIAFRRAECLRCDKGQRIDNYSFCLKCVFDLTARLGLAPGVPISNKELATAMIAEAHT